MIRINDSKSKTTLKAAVVVSVFLLFAAVMGFAQQQVNLTAGPTTTTLPDGTVLPMWGYSCGAAVTGSTATCAPLSGSNPSTSPAAAGALGGFYVINGGSGYTSVPSVTITPATGNTPTTPAAATAIVSGGQVVGFNVTNHGAGYTAAPTITLGGPGTGAAAAAAPAWSPVVITVPTGTVAAPASLQINLTNNLSFIPVGGGSANNIPTSIAIVGLVGGGLGSSHTSTPSPSHANAQGCVTWFIASGATPPGTPCTSPQAGASGTPPVQANRVQSMATEVAAVAPGTVSSTALTWANLRPGTYLLESSTHPSIQVPMGLIGMLVVTTAPSSTTAGTAYPAVAANLTNAAAQVAVPAVTYNAEVPLEFSEIDPVQNKEVDQAVRTPGFNETTVWTQMTPVGGGSITGLAVTSGGAGYSYPASVSFGAPGAGASANVILSFGVASVSAPAAGTGSGYVVGDTLNLSGGGGTGAIATVASVNATGAVLTANVTTVGSGYTSAPTVDTGASLAVFSVSAPAAGTGSGFAVGDTVSLTGGGGTGAIATVNSITATGGILTATVTSGGSGYTSAPTIDTAISPSVGTGAALTATVGTGAVLTATLATSGSVAGLSISTAGVGYTAASIVTITSATTPTTPAVVSLSFGAGGCGTTHTCYPPAVNYTPFYYLINGLAFNKTNPAASLFAATAGVSGNPPLPVTMGISATGTVLVRLVNAGLRMHVPSIVGSLTTGFNGAGGSATVQGFTLIAEDGNPLPNLGAPRVQTDVFMAAGKTFDVKVNVPAGTATALPVYDRELSLSANSSIRDAGMLAYIGVNGAGLPVANGSGVFAAAKANADTYNSISCPSTATSCTPLVISDPSKGVIANDINVYGVELSSPPTNGTLFCNALPGSPVAGICANGTFTYTPNPGATSDSFGYCANGAAAPNASLCTTVTLGASALKGNPVANAITYTAKTATYLKIASPGVLSVDTDPSELPLQVLVSSVTPSGVTVTMDPNGGFTATAAAAGTYTFTYQAQNSQGRLSNAATVTLIFPTPSNLVVKVLDAQAYNNCVTGNLNGNPSTCISGLPPITDYRWIIEEDKTFWVDPNCTLNSSITTPGCPSVVGPAGQSTIPLFATNFHTSTMDYVAQGCTGALSCEFGQTMLDTRPACTAPGVPAGCSATAGQHIPAVCDLGNGACRPDPGNGTSSGGFAWVNPSQVHLDPSKRYYISVLPGDAGNPFPSYTGTPNCLATPYTTGTTLNIQCGHTMSGAPIPPACNILTTGCSSTSTTPFAAVNVLVLPTPLPTGKLSVMVFEDDFPLNGEQDSGGGVDVLSPNEPGLGGFNLVLWDTFGGLGDVTGQDTYDMFNQPLSNSLAGTIDPATGLDACPISPEVTANVLGTGNNTGATGANPVGAQKGITGTLVTCPKYESDNATLSPLAGQAVIANLMPEKFSVQAYPAADRIARGEEWLQTNTLDGQHAHDSFIRIGEPSYFQEYGPAGYHVSIGFANPKIINDRAAAVCAGAFGTVGSCNNTVIGQVNVQRMSRTPDQRLYPSGSHDGLAWTQCWVSLGDPDAEDFMFTKCDSNGNFQFKNVPGGNWRLTIGDQWNDQIIDGLSTPANVGSSVPCPGTTSTVGAGGTCDMGMIGVQQWQSNVYTTLYIDDNKNGIKDPGEIGIPLIYTRIYYRDGHNSNGLNTDFNGVANFNETFPLFNWYVVEADSTRYKTTGIHTVYDAGGPADGSPSCGNGTNGARPCGTSTAYNFLANTYEAVPLPADLSVPGAVYCAKADCTTEAVSFAAGTAIPSNSAAGAGTGSSAGLSTGRIDPPWVDWEGWSGLTGQSTWIEFGKAPYAECNPNIAVSATNFCATVTVPPPPGSAAGTQPTSMKVGENGGIHGQVTYAATRPFDDASQMILQPWEPLVPGVTINLYQEGFAADGVTPTLTMVDTTVTTSWDAWAQGFYPNSAAGSGAGAGPKPYMNCPGQLPAPTSTTAGDMFFYTLYDQPNYLDYYNSIHSGGTTPIHPLPYNSQFKCYDAMHIWTQLQPATHDGEYYFPSSLGHDPTTGKLLAVKGATNGVASSINGTNCTICVANPDTTDVYRVGTPMLPPGKYVVEVIMPPGFEVYKEEDKNLLIGDNYIAPATQQFGGLGGTIFIIPDQASVASMYDPSAAGYNPNNFQNQTTALGLNEELSGVPGYPGFQDPVWPCVGEQRVVPDYLSLFPQAKEVAPFAGATRPLCDRKEVTLANQMSVRMHFAIYTSTHIASKFTGVITDDFTSEFDPFSPQFGEKFAPSNLPISTKDYLGNEISRVYSDHFGLYEGLTFSSWEVNPPNITGYSPTMMVQCMNDYGPITDTNPSSPTFGQMINDPLYNPEYSDFCYEEPYMPGLTTYLDTPVVPTQAFAGAGYNNADCAYPDATPAIAEVDGDGIGPWVSAPNLPLTITALGNVQVPNDAYSGPSANAAPFNLKTVTRHYGFGATAGQVTVGGVPLTNVTWSDTTITGDVPATVPPCTIQQQAQYGGPGTSGTPALCGQLVITAANGKQSVDTVTVTVGGKQPDHVSASDTIQSHIDKAAPGDLIIVDPTCTTGTGTAATVVPCTTTGAAKSAATHTELVIMWKPVRLQGAGAATTILNANTHPAGKMLDPWRRHISCLFGLTLQGAGMTGLNAYDPTGTFNCPETGWAFFGTDLTGTGSGTVVPENPQIDRMPSEGVLGWDATLNGNLAELLQEPSLMGAYEGAGITILARGVDLHGANPWDPTLEGAYPTGSTLLTGVVANPGGAPNTSGAIQVGDNNSLCQTSSTVATNPFPSNFVCNPSSIDGLSITNSSQGGGGIFIHGWAHFLQVANNRIYNNAGTLSGGISVGQGEFGPPTIKGGGAANLPPGSCSLDTAFATNQHLPWCLDLQVNVHNNMITDNSSIGDELFSATLSGGGGATVCTGSDYYKFNYNWVCGNLSSGEGGGLSHLGEIFNGDIEHNSIILNQSSNPTIPTNGGGIMVQGTPDTDPTCPGVPDADCPPGLSDGTGPGLVINANLIQSNSADSGSGGGIRLQQVDGTLVPTFPNPQPAGTPANCDTQADCFWNVITITNNIIANNMAGWDGAGISLQDAFVVNIVNNTIMKNDTLASSGAITQSIGTPQASAPAGNCVQGGNTTSCPQSAGVTSTPNSSLIVTAMTPTAPTCPPSHSGCRNYSNPILFGDVISQNQSFYIGVGTRGPGNLNQQNLVSLFQLGGAAAPAQVATGDCSGSSNYWDIGVRGDTSPTGGSGFTLTPMSSFLSSGSYTGNNNSTSDPSVIASYCNGSRVPPECSASAGCGGPHGFGTPPGIADALTPNPVFSLVPSATVDEGNNWINVSWGPLSLSSAAIQGTSGNWGGGPALGNYALASNSPAINYITSAPANVTVPSADFFGNPRPDPANPNAVDVGAVEFQGAGGAVTPQLTLISPQSGVPGSAVNVTLVGTGLTGASAVNAPGLTVTNFAAVSSSTVTATFTIADTAAAIGAHNVTVTTPSGPTNAVTFTVVGPSLTTINPLSGNKGTSVNVSLSGSGLTNATGLNTPPGITTSNFVVVSDTKITATLTIGNGTTTGSQNISVATPAGNTNNVTFTVVGPTLTSIAPAFGLQGTAVNVTLTGTDLGGATSVNPGLNITVSNFAAVNATTVTATLNIGNTAALGPRGVTVSTPAGATNAVTFTVGGPTLTSISPNAGAAGTSVNVTLTGTHLATATSVTTNDANITVTNFAAVNDTTVTATLNLAFATTAVSKNVTVRTAGGATSNAIAFTARATTITFSGPTPALCSNSTGTGGCSVGAASTTTKSGLVTVTNGSTATGPFNMTAAPTVAATSVPAGASFSIITSGPGAGTCTSTTVLNPGGSCTIGVQYVTGGSTANATAHVTITGPRAGSTLSSPNFTAN